MINASNTRVIAKLVRPSLSSSIFCVATGLAIVGILLLGVVTKNELYQQYFISQQQAPSGFYGEYQQASQTVNTSKAAADTSIFILWSIVGLALYYLAVGLAVMFTSIHGFLDHLGYRGADKKSLLRFMLLGLLLRIVAAIGLILVIQLSLYYLLPNMTTMIREASELSLRLIAVFGLVFLAWVVVVHCVVVLVRLFLLRTRIFFSHYYVDET